MKYQILKSERGEVMLIERKWAMSNSKTFSIKPIKELLQEEVSKLEKTSRRATQVKSKDAEILKLKLNIYFLNYYNKLL